MKTDSPQYQAALAEKKLEFIEVINSSTSLDTLRAWFDMYYEARYVAAMDSEEEELIKEREETEERFKLGWSH